MSTPTSDEKLCEDCPPVGYPTDKTRCEPCPRRQIATPGATQKSEDSATDESSRPRGLLTSNERLLELVGELDHYAETEGYERGYPGGLYSGQRQRARAELEAGIRALTSHETYDGLPVSQEPKYTVTNGRLVNRASGKPIPDDEPVFILRAKDRVAVYAIMAYRAQCTGNPEHHDAVDARVGDFLRFKEAHPQRIKSPDTTALKAGEQ